jgi:predicted ATPase
MRIAFSGVQNSGKTTLVRGFLNKWSNYTTPERTYRDLIKEKNLQHSSDCTKETQWEILNFMIDQLQSYTKTDKVIFDRCPIDNLVYSLWAYEKNIEGFDTEYINKCISIVKESLRHIDIIFLLRYDPSIVIEADGLRDCNLNYITEIDNIFAALLHQYETNIDTNVFFPKDDSPGFFELPTRFERRLEIISEYINSNGELYGEEVSVLTPENLNVVEELLKQQQLALQTERAERELFNKFKI